MRERRFLLPRSEWRAGRAYLDADASHHARRVLRLRPGDRVTVADGEGGAFFGLLAEDENGDPFIGELHPLARNGEPADRVTLAPALAKGDKLDVICEKATECGAFAFQPLLSERAEGPARAFGSLRPRLERIIRGAVQQSGRSRMPALLDPVAPATLPLEAYDGVLILHPGDAPALQDAALALAPARGGNFLLLTGPEGGFAEEEVHALASRGARPCSLGPRILRAETAGPLAVFAFLAARNSL